MSQTPYGTIPYKWSQAHIHTCTFWEPHMCMYPHNYNLNFSPLLDEILKYLRLAYPAHWWLEPPTTPYYMSGLRHTHTHAQVLRCLTLTCLHISQLYVYIFWFHPYVYIGLYLYIYIYLIYTYRYTCYICMVPYVCIHSTKVLYKMEGVVMLSLLNIVLFIYSMSYRNYVSQCCSSMAVCWLRSFIEALIQLIANLYFTILYNIA